ncbi:hypothetical protein DFS33DRAFT_885173 [Desarmillaria ectypa]|nr:hypothetical protein DFS33DRAFT_885173 [Desarmillaria ectypa]
MINQVIPFIRKLPQHLSEKIYKHEGKYVGFLALYLYRDHMGLHVSQVTGYITRSFILWDYLISIDDEVNLFWSSRRSWIKFLFCVNRYLGLFLRFWDLISMSPQSFKPSHYLILGL